MKKMYLLIAIAAVVSVTLIACGTKSESKMDATELAQFEAWKADKVKADAAELAQFEAWKAEKAKPVVHVVRKTSTTPTYRSPVMRSESQNAAKTTAKKGWSKAAKGAVIGGVVGAGAGAIINKRNRGAGAVIGGVLGAGGGYVIGRQMDKKDGRY